MSDRSDRTDRSDRSDRSDRAPWSELLHRLDELPDPDRGMALPTQVRRSGERRRRTRGLAVAVTVTGLIVVGMLGGTLLRGGSTLQPVPPATAAPDGSGTPPGPGRSVPADDARSLLRAEDLRGVGRAGRTWRRLPTPDTVSPTCDRGALPVGVLPAVALQELAADGRPLDGGGPTVLQVATRDASLAPACAGPGWTTVVDRSDLVLQRSNGDTAQGETPWATYRYVVRAADGVIVVGTAFLGEIRADDGTATAIGERMVARAAGRPVPAPSAASSLPASLRSSDLLPAWALGVGWAGDASATAEAGDLLAYLPCFVPGAKPAPEQTLSGGLTDTGATMPSGTRQQLSRFRSADVAAAWVSDVRRVTGCDPAAERKDVVVPGGVALREPTAASSAVRTVLVQRVGPIVSVTRVFVGDGEVPAALTRSVATSSATALCRWSGSGAC